MTATRTQDRGSGLAGTLLQRDFGRLWLAGLISNLGSWMTTTALPVYVFQQTGSALATTTVFTVSVLPLLFSSAAGVLVDRWDRRRVLIASNIALGAVTAPLLLAGSGRLWLVYACLFAQAVGQLTAAPAENALLPRLASEQQLPAANSLNALNDNLGRIIGPVLGTSLLAWSGFGAVVLTDVASFLTAAALVNTITRSRAGSAGAFGPSARSLAAEWRTGLSVIRRSRLLTTVFAAAATALLGDAILSSLLAPFVATTLGAGGPVLGVFLTIRGLGGVAGSVIVHRLVRSIAPGRLIACATTGLGLVVALLVVLPLVAAALVCAGFLGIFVVLWISSQQTLIQTTVADDCLGRVYGTLGTITAATLILGSILAGTLADVVGINTLFCAAAGCYATAGLIMIVRSGRRPNGPSRCE
ncbi:MAG: MFS transporter [Microlunatus sp.]|nr:MFS transporter [Microlunatus sp.]